MDSRSFFRGTSADQDDRFANKEKKLLKSMKFPPIFNQKVDITRVHLPSFKKWMNNQTKLLGIDDELLVDYVYELLEAGNPDPKVIQINITGFLENNTSQFMTDLWTLLVEAQNAEGGIPNEFLNDIVNSSLQAKNEEDRIKEALIRTKIKIENAHLKDTSNLQSYGLQQQQQTSESAKIVPINNDKPSVQKIKGVSKWDDMGPPTNSTTIGSGTTSLDSENIEKENQQPVQGGDQHPDAYYRGGGRYNRDSPDKGGNKRDRDYYDRKERDYYDSYSSSRYYSDCSRGYDRRERDAYYDRRYDDRYSYSSRDYDRRYDDRDSYYDRRYDDRDSYSSRDYDRKDKDSYYDKNSYSTSSTTSTLYKTKSKYSDDEDDYDKTNNLKSIKKRKDDDIENSNN